MHTSAPLGFIIRKRDGLKHSAGELESLVEAYLAGEVADYQMSAWLMAALLRGLDRDETVALTHAMLNSGRVLTLGRVDAPKVDKHSTGGVGDKVSLCLAPLVAACGVAVPMISGRGLGHTGGTLDKLEAIPGYDVQLGAERFERIVAEVGCSIIGQTAELAPADRRIYALRDVTGTVESIPLIVASILSKKLAAGLDALVLDVKVGGGAFMKDRESARQLARMLVRVGRQAGKRVVALLTDMSAPLGRAIGNAVETAEAIAILHGSGPADTRELTLALGEQMLLAAGVARSARQARARLVGALESGAALDRLARMIHAHGGDARVAEQPARLPKARQRLPVAAPRTGYVQLIDAHALGLCAVALGAGRKRAEDRVDPRVGIVLATERGARIRRGEPLAWLHVQRVEQGRQALEWIRRAFQIGTRRLPESPLVLERIHR